MNSGKPLTIYGLAKLAGLSAPTVSKALNGHPGVNSETRQLVLDLAAKHHYHPSRMARGLAKSRTENIGLVAVRLHGYPIFTNPYYSHILEGIESTIGANDYNLLLSIVDRDKLERLPKKVREKNVDGLILLSWMPEAFIEQLAAQGLPMVCIEHHTPKLNALTLLVDNEAGIQAAVDSLVKAGHSSIGFVGGQLSLQGFAERHAAFYKAIKSHGLKPGPELVAPEGRELMPAQFKTFLSLSSRPAALVAANDDHALKTLAAAKELGLRVPSDLALTGFDDIEAASKSDPPLSSARIDKHAIGVIAVERLISIIEGKLKTPAIERLPVQWIARGSV